MIEDIDRILLRDFEIQARVEELALQITRDYRDKELTIVALLHGSIFFLTDLLLHIPLPVQFSCIRVNSYDGTQSRGTINIAEQDLPNVEGRHLLILDDILDTGCTLQTMREHFLQKANALSVKTGVLLKKRGAGTFPIEADYLGFEIENAFVVGYGLDYRDRYRNLPFIGILKETAIEG